MVPRFLVALAFVGVIDAISYMVVAPSIIFYVLDRGGSKEQYGLILSAFSFSSFLAKPFIGHFSDEHGFRVPYIICLAVSAIGGFVYVIASAFHDATAVALILTARLLGGVGAASAALGYAYLAKSVSHEEQTKTNSLLSMARIIGMTIGPAFNVFLADIDTVWFGLHIDSLNSVGLVLIVANLMAIASIYFLLDEPPIDHTAPHTESSFDGAKMVAIVRSLMRIEILVPVFSIFAFNANFQLIEAGLAPAANHGLGWTPVGVSGILGAVSIILFLNMIIVFSLSARDVKDEYILLFGSALSVVGYYLVWDMWRWEAQPWQFVLPVVLGVSAFPFLGAPTRSIFTKSVDTIDILDGHQGSMQALLSMMASVAGFATPGLVAAYVLRDPKEVEQSSPRHRELSPYALVAPLMSAGTLVGVIGMILKTSSTGRQTKRQSSGAPDERTGLVSSFTGEQQQQGQPKKRYSAKIEVERRVTAECLGMIQSSMMDEHRMHEDYDSEDD